MKHNSIITLILICMFVITQLIGIAVISSYSPTQEYVFNETSGQIDTVIIQKELPYGMQPPEIDPEFSLTTILISFVIAILIIFLLMRIKAKLFLRIWFFVVVIIAIGITLNALFKDFLPYASIIALIIALPIAIFKIFKRNMLVHNLSELLIYPGIAAVFVPLLNIPVAIILLLAISAYDIWAVWHSGFMQKLANFHINELKLFGGFFVPYAGKKIRLKIKNLKQQIKTEKGKSKSKKTKQAESKLKSIKINLAILGGGDVVFPLILAGVVLRTLGVIPALIVVLGASVALSLLLIMSKKGKFYPAMPFLTSGVLFGLALALLIP